MMMSFTRNVAIAALVATPALGQVFPDTIFGLPFSSECQAAVVASFVVGGLGQCLPVGDLLPLLSLTGAPSANATGVMVPGIGVNATIPDLLNMTAASPGPIMPSSTSDSIAPIMDEFMTDLCYNYPSCTNQTLSAAVQRISTGCASDLQKSNLSSSIVEFAINLYPTVRETLCLKTSNPYVASSYGGFLGAPVVPVTAPVYNSTNGTFCVTSFITQLSAYFGTNVSVALIGSIVSGENQTAVDLVKSTNPNVLCNECLFGAADVVERAYPMLGSVPVTAITNFLGVDGYAFTRDNDTINELFNSTCAYKNMSVSTDGMLPANVTVSIVNSTYPYTLSNGMMSFSPMAMAKRYLFGRKIVQE